MEWFYGGACVAIGVYLFAIGDNLGGAVSVGVGILTVVLIHLLAKLAVRVQSYPPSAEELRAEADLLRKRGLEPVPIPGEEFSHNDNCELCRILRKRGINP
jgi:hypothetical protein